MRFAQRGRRRIVKWIATAVGLLIAIVRLLDTFGGYLFDGPLGPIPGGAFKGPVNPEPHPDWSQVEKVIELEIRPAKPWSLSIWAVRGGAAEAVQVANGGRGPCWPLPPSAGGRPVANRLPTDGSKRRRNRSANERGVRRRRHW